MLNKYVNKNDLSMFYNALCTKITTNLVTVKLKTMIRVNKGVGVKGYYAMLIGINLHAISTIDTLL